MYSKNLKIIDLTELEIFSPAVFYGIINNFPLKECSKKGTEMSSKVIQKLVLGYPKFFLLKLSAFLV